MKNKFKMLVWISLVLINIVPTVFSQTPDENPNMKKIAMVIAHNNFRDEEFLEPKNIFKDNGFQVTVASSKMSEATGMLGAKVNPDILVKDINVEDYAAVVFVGGSGAREYFHDTVAHNILIKAYKLEKVVAAICIAPNTLANAGLLKGVKATCWDSENLVKRGAIYTGNSVESSGRIITGKNPHAASSFAKAIIDKINE